ncbi:phosphatase PAP2 family protein [Candidatus Latescibacterota bacterium]
MKNMIKARFIISTILILIFLIPSAGYADSASTVFHQLENAGSSEQFQYDFFRPNIISTYLPKDNSINKSVLFAAQNNNWIKNDSGNPSFHKRVIRDIRHAWDVTLSDFTYIYSSPARINKGSALWIGGFLALGGVIFAYDQEIYDAIHRNKDHKLYKPFLNLGEACEDLGYMGFTNKYFFAALFTGYLIENETMMNISADILESFGVAALGKNTTMWGVGRYGPALDMGPRHFKSFDGRSMPSGHSSAVMQFSTVMAKHIDYLPFKIAAYTCATSVLFQRITSDHHWPSDVYVGATYGRLIASTIMKRANNRRLKVTPAQFYGSDGTGFQVTFGF